LSHGLVQPMLDAILILESVYILISVKFRLNLNTIISSEKARKP
jgi:hypothetical protein